MPSLRAVRTCQAPMKRSKARKWTQPASATPGLVKSSITFCRLSNPPSAPRAEGEHRAGIEQRQRHRDDEAGHDVRQPRRERSRGEQQPPGESERVGDLESVCGSTFAPNLDNDKTYLAPIRLLRQDQILTLS
jgi:hypothetical protein